MDRKLFAEYVNAMYLTMGVEFYLFRTYSVGYLHGDWTKPLDEWMDNKINETQDDYLLDSSDEVECFT